jgi:hypothetical protein
MAVTQFNRSRKAAPAAVHIMKAHEYERSQDTAARAAGRRQAWTHHSATSG